MSQEDIKAAVARDALRLCNDRIASGANVALPGIMESIRVQLEWLVSYFEGRNNEREKLFKLVFGHYAAREVDQNDEEFIDALSKAYYVADKTRMGLKIDPKEIGYS